MYIIADQRASYMSGNLHHSRWCCSDSSRLMEMKDGQIERNAKGCISSESPILLETLDPQCTHRDAVD